MPQFIIKPDEKYALLAITGLISGCGVEDEQQIDADLWASRSLPFDIAEHWKDWIGSIATGELENANFFLLTKGPSANPEILDGDNKKYQVRVFRFYQGLWLTGFYRCDGQPLLLTGANQGGVIDVRDYRGLPNPHYIPGSPIDNIDADRLSEAAKLAVALANLHRKGKFDCFGRIINAFFAGIESVYADESLHHFIRCVEGFILPDPGDTRRQLRSRTELFIGSGHHNFIGDLFDIRSSVEHLHNPIRDIKGPTERDKWLTLFKRAYEAGAIARYTIRTFLLSPNQDLKKHFEDDNGIKQFWSLTGDERRKIWGDPLDMTAISNQFDPSGVRDDELGS